MASDPHQLNMYPTELSNPEIMEGSAEMASSSFSTSQMRNTSMQNQADQSQSYQLNAQRLLSGAGMNFQQTIQAQFNQGYQVQSDIDEMNFQQFGSCGVVHFQQISQPQLNEAYQNQSQIDQSNSLHSQQSQLNQAGQSQTDQMNSLQSASDRLMHSQPTNQARLSEAYQSQTDQSNSLQPTSSGVRNSQQSKLNRAGQSQADQLNSSRCTNGRVMPFEERRQPQLIQGEASQDSQHTESGNGKTFSEAVIKKRAADKRYRDREREKKRAANDRINSLRMERDMLAAEYRRSLQESIRCPQPNEQLPAQARQSHIQQIHHPSFSAPVASFPRDHHGTHSKEVDQIRAGYDLISAPRMERDILAAERRRCIQASTSCPQPNYEPLPAQARQSTIEQFHHPNLSALQFNGSQMSNDVQDPHRTISSSTGGIVSSSHLTENQENSRAAGTSTLMAELLKKINENSKSKVSDFTGLDLDHGERVAVGRYSFPKSLHSTVEKIIEQYGDVTENSKMHPSIDERTYILFCATIKEMDDQQLEEVTEDNILKWSDTIKDALRINFNVGFAMNHLKENIVPAYIGRIERQEVNNMALTISKLEATLNASREEYAIRLEQSKVYKDAVEKFNGKSVSTGLFK